MLGLLEFRQRTEPTAALAQSKSGANVFKYLRYNYGGRQETGMRKLMSVTTQAMVPYKGY